MSRNERLEFEKQYLPIVKARLEGLGFSEVTRQEHNALCDFKANFYGTECWIEVRGRRNSNQITMKRTKYDRLVNLLQQNPVYLYAFNEMHESLTLIGEKLKSPFGLSFIERHPRPTIRLSDRIGDIMIRAYSSDCFGRWKRKKDIPASKLIRVGMTPNRRPIWKFVEDVPD